MSETSKTSPTGKNDIAMRRSSIYTLYLVCYFAIGVVLNVLNDFAVRMDGCNASEISQHLHRLG